MKVSSEARISRKQTSGWPASPEEQPDRSKHGVPQHENTAALGTNEMVNLAGRHRL